MRSFRIFVNSSTRDSISEVDLAAFRLLLIGSLNATLEGFDPKQGRVEDLAESYANILLGGLLTQGGGGS